MTLLESHNLAIGFGQGRAGRTLHSGIELVISSHQFVCVVGPNGAGKSTLLRTLAGFIPRRGGTICIADRALDDWSASELAKVRAFCSTQRTNPLEMTVFELVSLGRHPHTDWTGILRGKDRRAVEHSMEIVGLASFGDRKLSTLSDGERQRASIATAIAQEAKLIFLDEPTAFLDALGRREIMHLLGELARSNERAVVCTTHELEIAVSLADSIWMLPVGGLFSVAKPSETNAESLMSKLFSKASAVGASTRP